MNKIEFLNKKNTILASLLGKEIFNNVFGKGIILEIGEHVKVDFSGTVKTMAKDQFFDFNRPIDQKINDEIDLIVKEHEIYLKKKEHEAKVRREELIERVRKESEKQKILEESSKRKTTSKKSFNEKFGSDYNLSLLKRTPVLTYKDVEEEHNIKISGYGRGINVKDNSVILISTVGGNSDHFTYHDRWNHDGYYEYCGEGSIGDQTLTAGNKAIIDASESGTPIYLYVKFGPKEYYPQGIMKLVEYKLVEALDKKGNLRKEYVFILKRI